MIISLPDAVAIAFAEERDNEGAVELFAQSTLPDELYLARNTSCCDVRLSVLLPK